MRSLVNEALHRISADLVNQMPAQLVLAAEAAANWACFRQALRFLRLLKQKCDALGEPITCQHPDMGRYFQRLRELRVAAEITTATYGRMQAAQKQLEIGMLVRKYGLSGFVGMQKPQAGGTDRVTWVLSSNSEGIRHLLVAVRGTVKTSIYDWLTNVHCCGAQPIAALPTGGVLPDGFDGVSVHPGFLARFLQEWNNPAVGTAITTAIAAVAAVAPVALDVLVAGHSQGGAVGTLIAAALYRKYPHAAIRLVTFSSPRLFYSRQGAAAFDTLPIPHFRFYSHKDCITHFSFCTATAHCETGIAIRGGEHAIDAIEKLIRPLDSRNDQDLIAYADDVDRVFEWQ